MNNAVSQSNIRNLLCKQSREWSQVNSIVGSYQFTSNMNDQDTYKRRSIILSHDSDCFHHVEEMRRWRDHLVNNANNKHKDKLNLAELEFNLEYNPLKLWRPWFRLEDSYDYLQGATNGEYREIIKKMIFNCEDSAKDIG